MLPALTHDGLLPPGRHKSTVVEVYDRFVKTAPNRSERDDIFSAFELWRSRALAEFGAGVLWINGGFVTHKAAAPHDLDLAFFPADLPLAEASLLSGDGYQLLTIQDLLFAMPRPGGWLRRVQPAVGLIDAFLARPGDALTWHGIWSSVKGPTGDLIPGKAKGYVEVVMSR
ncbi:MAG TPA: hypothetical protein VFK41_01940 [Nocardioidaceae bacterium]|nr:hypothetical protein [Nocardioidaceae bacterium]